MELPRFYCRSISKPFVELDVSQAHHLIGVLRIAKGNKVELFDGAGSLATATVTSISRKTVTLEVNEVQLAQPVSGPKIIIASSIAKGERFDWLIGKCTELGVDRICPVIFERTVKQSKNPKVIDRWQNLAIAAAKQCRRLFLPQIDRPMQLHQALEILKKEHSKSQILLGSLAGQCHSLLSEPFGKVDVIAFVGPEGGVTEQEELVLQKAGAQPVRLTDTVLRIETAALAFAAILTTRRDFLTGQTE